MGRTVYSGALLVSLQPRASSPATSSISSGSSRVQSPEPCGHGTSSGINSMSASGMTTSWRMCPFDPDEECHPDEIVYEEFLETEDAKRWWAEKEKENQRRERRRGVRIPVTDGEGPMTTPAGGSGNGRRESGVRIHVRNASRSTIEVDSSDEESLDSTSSEEDDDSEIDASSDEEDNVARRPSTSSLQIPRPMRRRSSQMSTSDVESEPPSRPITPSSAIFHTNTLPITLPGERERSVAMRTPSPTPSSRPSLTAPFVPSGARRSSLPAPTRPYTTMATEARRRLAYVNENFESLVAGSFVNPSIETSRSLFDEVNNRTRDEMRDYFRSRLRSQGGNQHRTGSQGDDSVAAGTELLALIERLYREEFGPDASAVAPENSA